MPCRRKRRRIGGCACKMPMQKKLHPAGRIGMGFPSEAVRLAGIDLDLIRDGPLFQQSLDRVGIGGRYDGVQQSMEDKGGRNAPQWSTAQGRPESAQVSEIK